jgi:hypothetical protein
MLKIAMRDYIPRPAAAAYLRPDDIVGRLAWAVFNGLKVNSLEPQPLRPGPFPNCWSNSFTSTICPIL